MVTAVGYQPVGMRPSRTGLVGVVTSRTATELMPASATYRRVLSGETARALGYDPCTLGLTPPTTTGARLKSGYFVLLEPASDRIPMASSFDLATYMTSVDPCTTAVAEG